MDKIKLELREKSDPEFVQFTDAHIAAMTGNANFGTPVPPALDFKALRDRFQQEMVAAENAEQAWRQAIVTKDEARAALEAGFNVRAAYIQTESAGDAAKILSSGLQLRAPNAPIGPLPAPIDFLATMGDMEGEIDVTWSRVKGAKSYIVQVNDYDGPRNWTQRAVVTKSKATVSGLVPGKKFVFRVCAVGTAGNSPWSDESVQMAP